MQFNNITELKEISIKHFIEVFGCHKKVAKEILEILNDYKKNKILYEKEQLNFTTIKLYIFDNNELFKMFNLFFQTTGKEIDGINEYNIKNNCVVKEKIKDRSDERINEYSIDGKLLLKFYNFGKNIEFYTWKEDKYVLEKIEYCNNGKMGDYEDVVNTDENGNFLLVLKDKYTNMDKKTRMLNIKEIIRPDRLGF